MLKQRVITALILLAILLPAVFYPSVVPFGVVSLILIAASSWEWARLNGQQGAAALAWGLGCAVLCGVAWAMGGVDGSLFSVWLAAGGVWVLACAWLLNAGPSIWLGVPVAARLLIGLGALVVAWLAVMQARILGINFLFSVLALVWVADIAAYFAGRALGGRFITRKLAAAISPGKTWEGALGGMLGVVVLAWIWQVLDAALPADQRSLYSRLHQVHGGLMVLGVLFLGAMSVAGDLAESLFKRAAGVKDSSALLPGHGGVLDRLDALLPTLPLAMLLTTLVSR